jgi:ribosomal protein S18 acetylase RimI-like enzyme
MIDMGQDRPPVQIRLAVENDASGIASVLHESFVEFESSYTHEAFTATAPTSDQIQSRMKEGSIWVALQTDTIVGTVSAVSKGHDLYIRGMAVLPAARGQKIGELLLRQIESFAFAHGYKRLILSTTPFLKSAIRLYEHFGFRRSSEGPHDLFRTPLFTMTKHLEPPD